MNVQPTSRRHRPRARASVVACAAALALLLAGCATASERRAAEDEASHSATATTTTPAADSVAELSVSPAEGAVDVMPDVPVTVRVAAGRLEQVSVTGPDGAVEGAYDPSRLSWTSSGALGLGTSYTVHASAIDANGLPATMTSAFTTLTPTTEQTLDISMAPLEGEVVGVGMPVVLYMSDPVSADYRAAVEAELGVTSTPAVEGGWHWFSDSELHWRPRELWPAGTQVQVDLVAEGARAGESLWAGGQEGLREIGSFSITPVATTSVVNLEERSLKVYQDGVLARTIPVTGGKPGWETRNGTKVILEKHRDKRMDAATLGIDPDDPEYYALDVEYALRVTWSGEFVHSAPWSEGQQGQDLVSHGCVGMSEADAAWFFDLSTKGDVLTVTGSPRPLEKGNGYTDWNFSWDEWLAGSAVGSQPATTAPAG